MTQSDHHPYPLLEAGVAWARRVVSFGAPSPRFKCLVSDDDDEAVVVTSKPLPFLRSLAPHDPAAHLLIDCLEGFELLHGTGTGMVVALVSCLGHSMLSLVKEGYPWPCVVNGFEEAAKLCVQVCGALSIPLEDLNQVFLSPHANTNSSQEHGGLEPLSCLPPEPNMATSMVQDEYSWFFDGPESAPPPPSPPADSQMRPTTVGLKPQAHGNDPSLSQIASWLQVYSPSDYSKVAITQPVFVGLSDIPGLLEEEEEEEGSVGSGMLSLPMHLAVTAWSCLTPPRCSPIIHKLIGPMTSYSRVIPRGVLIPVHPHYRSQISDLMANKMVMLDQSHGRVIRFRHVVCLLDNFSFPGGVSEEAESYKPRATVSTGPHKKESILSCGRGHPSAMLSLFQRYQVDLLCVQGPLEEALRQACHNAGIMVLTDLRRAEADAVSRIAQGHPIEDLRDLDGGSHVGTVPVWGAVIEAGWSGPCDERFFGTAVTAVPGVCLPQINILLTGLSNGASTSSTAPPALEEPPTIVLTAPTPFMATMLEEQVGSCLAQLEDCTGEGRVLAGWGLFDILSIVMLELRADEAEGEQQTAGDDRDGRLYQPIMWRAFAGALRDLILESLVLVKEPSIEVAVTCLHKAVQGVRDVLQGEGYCMTSSIMTTSSYPPHVIRALLDQCAIMGEGVMPWPCIEAPRAREDSYGFAVRFLSRLVRLKP